MGELDELVGLAVILFTLASIFAITYHFASAAEQPQRKPFEVEYMLYEYNKGLLCDNPARPRGEK